MGFYHRLLQTVSRQALLGQNSDGGGSGDAGFSAPLRPRRSHPNRSDRMLRTPLVFETLEPRVLLSGDPISGTV